MALQTSEIHADGPHGLLAGSLLSPAGASDCAVLIIPGSGPTDRDGNNPFGIKSAMYRLLAEGLADRSIASLRVDKRGMFGSAAAVPDANAVTLADYADDVLNWVAVLRERTAARRLYLLGHSEGAMVALAAAERADVDGLILLCSPGRPLGVIVREQFAAMPEYEALMAPVDATLAEFAAGRHVASAALPPALQSIFPPAVQNFVIDVFRYDPAALLARETRPVLIVQGLRDLQIGLADARALQQAGHGARLLLLPHMNHVLKDVPENDRAANLAAYADPALPLSAGLVSGIADFLADAR
ncbi:alpha/beta hydrolase [Paludibacterium yongneupense]|uniref:alpha/beta hydrolase n=1 Tax=Paludibacterium yongneupense TaxID=400061 RepID=UPI0003F4CB76|nr:alpha/beta fold hydrolase [Paludibacterium yongneupense]